MFNNRKGMDGVYWVLLILGLLLGMGLAYVVFRFIPSFASMVGACA